jgi:hypothetical protein
MPRVLVTTWLAGARPSTVDFTVRCLLQPLKKIVLEKIVFSALFCVYRDWMSLHDAHVCPWFCIDKASHSFIPLGRSPHDTKPCVMCVHGRIFLGIDSDSDSSQTQTSLLHFDVVSDSECMHVAD